MSDVVELSIPVGADLLTLVRLTAATVAARADFGIEEVEDLRLVAEELCLSVALGATTGVLRLQFTRQDGEVTIHCTYEPDGSETAPADEPDELSIRIIEALVDECGFGSDDGTRRGWVRKHRSRVAS